MLDLEKILPYLEYNPDTGDLFVLKSGTKRKLVPNADGMIQTCINGSKVKTKFNRLVVCAYTGKMLSDTMHIFHRDLDLENFRINNLAIVSKEQHFKIQECLKNLQGATKLQAHPKDMFKYVLEYKENGRLKREVISDAVVAKARLREEQFKCIKYLCNFILTT
jgi:hypothetical protein